MPELEPAIPILMSETCCSSKKVRKFFLREIWFRDLEKANVCRGIGFLAKPYVVFKIILTSKKPLSKPLSQIL